MSIRRILLLLIIIACAVAGGFLLGQQTAVFVNAQRKPVKSNKILDLLRQFEKEKIKDFAVLEFDDNKFYAVIRETDEPLAEDSIIRTSDKLSIFNESGKVVYENRDIKISGLKIERLLKADERELLFTSNGGGTDWYINVLSCKNGKFTEMLDAADTQYRGGYFTMLQYRTGNKTPYFKPSQLILIKQQGGADENPSASVFRAKDGKLQKAGEIKMRDFGDFIEKRLDQTKPIDFPRKDASAQRHEDFFRMAFGVRNDQDISEISLIH